MDRDKQGFKPEDEETQADTEAGKPNEYEDLLAEAKQEAAAERSHLASALMTEAERLNADTVTGARLNLEGSVRGVQGQLAELRRVIDVEGDTSEAHIVLVEQLNGAITAVDTYHETTGDRRLEVRRAAEPMYDAARTASEDGDAAGAALEAAQKVEQALTNRSSGYRQDAETLVSLLGELSMNEKLSGPQRDQLQRGLDRIQKATEAYLQGDEKERERFSQLVEQYKQLV